MKILRIQTKPNRLTPARETDVEAENFLLNDVILPGAFNPHNVRPWAIGNEYRILGVVWASCEGDALDILVDEELGNSLIVTDPKDDEA